MTKDIKVKHLRVIVKRKKVRLSNSVSFIKKEGKVIRIKGTITGKHLYRASNG